MYVFLGNVYIMYQICNNIILLVDFSWCNLTGSIPQSIKHCTSLQILLVLVKYNYQSNG